jgi:hypothetical protein
MPWVGCGNMMEFSDVKEEDPPPAKDDVIWHCFAVAEVPFWKRIFKKPDTSISLAKLDKDLNAILSNNPGITLVEEP